MRFALRAGVRAAFAGFFTCLLLSPWPAAAQAQQPVVDKYVPIPNTTINTVPAIVVDAGVGHVYVGAQGHVFVYDQAGTYIGEVPLSSWNYHEGSGDPTELAVDRSNHRVYVTVNQTATLKIIDGVSLSEIATLALPSQPRAAFDPSTMLFSSADAKLYLTTDDGVLAFDPAKPSGDPGQFSFALLQGSPLEPLVIDETSQLLLVGDFDGVTNSSGFAIVDVNPGHGQAYQTVVASVVTPCGGGANLVALDPRRHVLYCGGGGGSLFAYDIDPSHISFGQQIASGQTPYQAEHVILFVNPVSGTVYVTTFTQETFEMPHILAFDGSLSQLWPETPLLPEGTGYNWWLQGAIDPASNHVYIGLAYPPSCPVVTTCPFPPLIVIDTPFQTAVTVTPVAPDAPFTMNTPEVSIAFPAVASGGTVTIQAIDGAALDLTLSGAFSVTGAAAYEISSTVTSATPIALCFNASDVTDPVVFASLVVLHGENGAWVDRTTTRDFATGTICASVSSFSPFAIARRVPAHYTVKALFDQTKSVRAGSTVPLKLQIIDVSGANASSPAIPVTALTVALASSTVTAAIADSGNANPDGGFRYDPALAGYIFNLSTKGLAAGTYDVTFAVSGDPDRHSLRFGVRQ